MAEHIAILKNTTLADIVYNKLAGMRIPASGQYTASDTRTIQELHDCVELNTDILSGDIVLNDGTSDLTAEDGVSYLEPYAPTKPVSSITFIDSVTGVDQFVSVASGELVVTT